MIRIFLIILGVLLAGAAIGLTSINLQETNSHFTTVSPDKTFSVQMRERVETDGGRDLILDVMKSNQPFFKDIVYYHGTSLDGSFFRMFPKTKWVSASVLWFGRTNTRDDLKDHVTVVSESSSSIRFLTVNSPAESFLILDLPPGGKVDLKAAPQSDKTADISGFSCLAFLDDGTTRKRAANFNIRGLYKGPSHYNIILTDGGITVTSIEFESIH